MIDYFVLENMLSTIIEMKSGVLKDMSARRSSGLWFTMADWKKDSTVLLQPSATDYMKAFLAIDEEYLFACNSFNRMSYIVRMDIFMHLLIFF